MGPFSRLEFPNGISRSIYMFLVVCTSSRSTELVQLNGTNGTGLLVGKSKWLPSSELTCINARFVFLLAPQWKHVCTTSALTLD